MGSDIQPAGARAPSGYSQRRRSRSTDWFRIISEGEEKAREKLGDHLPSNDTRGLR
jgi:hypothetical protein